LTETDGKTQSNQASDSASAAVSARLKWTVVAIVFLLAAAMGLKAWDEHQRADANLLLTLQAEAEALAGRVAGRADTVETAIRLVADNHASRSAIASATPGVDAVMSLKDAQ
jgi:two-component system, cell cycle sensor histidine kinase PleC